MKNTIKIYTKMNEANKTHFYKDFEIVDKLPEVGNTYGDQYEVITVKELTKDCEQGRPEAYDYKIYEVIAEDITERGNAEYYEYRYLAIEIEE